MFSWLFSSIVRIPSRIADGLMATLQSGIGELTFDIKLKFYDQIWPIFHTARVDLRKFPYKAAKWFLAFTDLLKHKKEKLE